MAIFVVTELAMKPTGDTLLPANSLKSLHFSRKDRSDDHPIWLRGRVRYCDLSLGTGAISRTWRGGECPPLAAAARVYEGGGCVVG